MLGGYYLGQIYLGISGTLSQKDVLIIQSATHNHYADNLEIIQLHFILIDGTIHSVTSENIDLEQLHNLLVSNTLHSVISDKASLTQLHNLLVGNANHSLTSSHILKIFNWDELGKFFGTYLKDYGDEGVLDKLDTPEKSIYILDREKLGTFTGSEPNETGTYIKDNNKQGIL